MKQFCWIFLVWLISISAAKGSEKVIDQVIGKMDAKANLLEEPELQKYIVYKENVQRNAYAETLKLCRFYRSIRYPEQTRVNNQHGVFIKSGNSQEELSAWLKVAKEGLMHPVDSVFGNKATHLEINHTSSLSYEYWFQSLYSLFLVGSPGFAKAAVHCLATTDPDELNMFAGTIVLVDAEATFLAELGVGWTIEKVIKFLFKAVKFVLSPLKRLTKAIDFRITKTHMRIGALFVIPVAVENYVEYMKEMTEANEAIKHIFSFDESSINESRRMGRVLLATKAVNQFLAFDKRQLNQDEFISWCQKEISMDTMDQFREDLKRLRNRPLGGQYTKEDSAYFIVLKAIVPILDQVPGLKGAAN